MGLQRQFERHLDFEAGNIPPKVLEERNEKVYEKQDRYLHPTKGFRKVRVERGRAQMIMAEQRAGKFPFPWQVNLRLGLEAVSKYIRTGFWR